MKNGSYFARLTLTLFGITAVVALLLALVNDLTCDRIAALEVQAKNNAMSQVVADADTYSEVEYTQTDGIQAVYAAYQDTTLVGYCVEVAPNGFGGAIDMMVGVLTDGTCSGVTILSHSETAGLGSKAATDDTWREQYTGLSGVIGVYKTSPENNAIKAITGATITSKAVTRGVNLALALVAEGGVG